MSIVKGIVRNAAMPAIKGRTHQLIGRDLHGFHYRREGLIESAVSHYVNSASRRPRGRHHPRAPWLRRRFSDLPPHDSPPPMPRCPLPMGSRSRHPAWRNCPKAMAFSRCGRPCSPVVRKGACSVVHQTESRSTARKRALMGRRVTDFDRAEHGAIAGVECVNRRRSSPVATWDRFDLSRHSLEHQMPASARIRFRFEILGCKSVVQQIALDVFDELPRLPALVSGFVAGEARVHVVVGCQPIIRTSSKTASHSRSISPVRTRCKPNIRRTEA